MAYVLRRLQRLEVRVSDGSGLPPNSKGWCDYWLQKYDEFLAGDRTIMFPLEAIRMIMRSIDSSADMGGGRISPRGRT